MIDFVSYIASVSMHDRHDFAHLRIPISISFNFFMIIDDTNPHIGHTKCALISFGMKRLIGRTTNTCNIVYTTLHFVVVPWLA